MKLVQPIRDKNKIEDMKRELLKSGVRDYMLFVFGINTGLRISDILNLKACDVKGREHILLIEKKTGKSKRIKINTVLRKELDDYTKDMGDNDYIFTSRNGDNTPIGRVQAYRILNNAASNIGIDEIGTHTLRKTFGYFHYQRFKDVALLQELFNHSAPSVTLRYIGINQDMLDKSIDDFGL